jgi:transcriptional regulator with XRE-family HTH domain
MNNEISSDLAARLVALRKQRGLTQQKLAEMLGIDCQWP